MEIAEFEALLSAPGQALLSELAGFEESAALALGERLRARFPAPLVAAAMTQARLRERGRAKFGDAAAAMYFTPDGLEQATRRSVAELRARRYAAAGVRRVADLCCGVGGDALAFAAAGLRVLAVDRDPLTCAVARANAAAAGLAELIEVRCADVTDAQLGGCDAVFLDPARRGARGRVFDPDAYSPPWSFVLQLVAAAGAGSEDFAEKAGRPGPAVKLAAFKVAPGLPHELIPPGATAEWVSEHGAVKELGIYVTAAAAAAVSSAPHGPQTPATDSDHAVRVPAPASATVSVPARPGVAGTVTRLATLLPGPHTLAARGLPDPEAGPVRRYLYEPDGAVIRAHLLGELAAELDATTVDPTIAYLSSDTLRDTPFADAYEVTDVLPFNVKRLRALVAERRIGTLTVKKRGADVDPAALRRQLRPSGPHAAVLIVTRVLGAHTAVIAAPADGARRWRS